ncbi:MAG TPA: phosphodiester glycosidase family protein [Patescibacteria group bacterium]|nr:phosphodiester glycosidase family protein [Patescibacteria group bacterium]
MRLKLPKWKQLPLWHWIVAGVVAVIVVLSITTWAVDAWDTIQEKIQGTTWENQKLQSQVATIAQELSDIQHQDQYVKNKQLSSDITDIESTYQQTVATYEDLLRLKDVEKDTTKYDDAFADVLSLLSKRNYASAASELTTLQNNITGEQQKIASSFTIPSNVPSSNAPPGSGFSQQSVTTDIGTFLVDMIAADVSTTHVYVDTASSGTCGNNCPVLPLGDYVSRTGAFAGVNGGYFCPADYPSCAGKTGSFDTLLMNKNKVYFNSDNNVYSTVPAVIFGNGFIRFVGRSLEWGRDTGIDSMIANQPLVLSGGTIAFGGNGDPKMSSKSTRGFVANKGNTVYIGMMFNASVSDMGHIAKALGFDNTLNLDDGGSAALWSGGYKVGPGRNLPNAIVFVRK